MKIAVHQMEPWLIEYQDAPFNLAESGVLDQTVEELLSSAELPVEQLLKLSLRNIDTHGSPELRAAIAAVYDQVDPDSVLVTTGTSEALLIYFLLRYEPGANVVVPVPAFQSLYEVPRYLNYEVRFLQLRAENGFRPDLDELARLVDDRTRVVVLNTPHNPTGIVFSEAEIQAVLALAERHGAEILADEHYRFMPYASDELLPSLYGRSPQVVATGSMIKCFGCVGLRIGWLIGPPELIASSRDFKDYTTHTICAINDRIADAALRRWQAIVPRYQGWVEQNVAQFRAFVAEHRALIDWVEPQAGVVAFPFFRDPAIDSARFAERLVAQTGVFVLPGSSFDMPQHFRIGFGVPPQQFAAALSRIDAFISDEQHATGSLSAAAP